VERHYRDSPRTCGSGLRIAAVPSLALAGSMRRCRLVIFQDQDARRRLWRAAELLEGEKNIEPWE